MIFICYDGSKIMHGDKVSRRATSLATGRSVTVRVNDTGGFAKFGRAMDLSKAAFARIAPLGQGTAKVCLERLS